MHKNEENNIQQGLMAHSSTTRQLYLSRRDTTVRYFCPRSHLPGVLEQLKLEKTYVNLNSHLHSQYLILTRNSKIYNIVIGYPSFVQGTVRLFHEYNPDDIKITL